jgi:hypothetical protein
MKLVTALVAGALLGAAPLASEAGPPTLLNTSLVRVRADNHFGVLDNHDIFPVFTPGTFSDSITDTEIGTDATATTSATYEISLTGLTAVFDIQTQQSFTVESAGNLAEGFIQFTLDEPYVYELSGHLTGTSTDAGDAWQQRTFLRQFVSPFTTIYLEDERGIGTARWLYVNLSNDTGGGSGTFNQSGPRRGVLPPGTYEFMYELESVDNDNDLAGAGAASGRVRLVLRKPLAPTNLQAVTTAASVALSWTDSIDAASYILEAGSAPGAANVFNGDIGNTMSLQSPAPAGIYYVRLRARNGAAIGPPSEEHTFTIGNVACTQPPIAPANHAVRSVGLSAALGWGPSPGASSYIVEAGSAPALADLYNANVGGRTELSAAAPAGAYFTRIRGVNGCGVGDPSNEVSFTIGCTAPLAPAEISFTKLGGLVTITWQRTFGAASYILQAGTASGLANAFNGSVGPGPSVSFPAGGVPPGVYFVRALAAGSCATSGPSPEVVITVP